MPNHMMVDLETLDTSPRSLILQVGLVVFDPDDDQRSFISRSWNVDLGSCHVLGGTYSESTLLWWLTNTEEARRSVAQGPRAPITTVLQELGQTYRSNGCQAVWSHGATFDIPILAYYYDRLKAPLPWKFWAARDTRTLFALAKDLAGHDIEKRTVAHTAEADARAQAEDVQAALKALRERTLG